MTSIAQDRILGANAGLAVKAPCVAVATTNIALSGLTQIGNYVPSVGDRILVIGQTDQTTNGIYQAQTGAWTRSVDFSSNTSVVQGTLVVVSFAPAGQSIFYQLTAENPIEIGSTDLTFAAFWAPGFDYPTNQAEASAGINPTNLQYEWNNVLRYGIVPNNAGAAAANTAALAALLNPAVTGPVGVILFPNTTGADVYYFDGMIGVRAGVTLDLQGCTLSFAVAGTAADSGCGCFTAQRDFHVIGRGGTIALNYAYTSGTDNGNVLMFGGRGTDVGLFPAIYDSLLAVPMGNISVEDVYINLTSSYEFSRGIFALGGLNGVTLKRVRFEGNNSGYEAMYYEFGWATDESDESARQTSHMHNFRAEECTVTDFTFGGLDGNGAYRPVIDGLSVRGTPSAAQWGVGEAMFYRPWNPVDLAGAKQDAVIRNVDCDAPSGTAIIITGSGVVTSTYLGESWEPNTAYILNATRVNGGNMYLCTQAGTSAAAGGPTGTGNNIVDNTCRWNYVPLTAVTDLFGGLCENIRVLNAGGYGIRGIGATRLVCRHGKLIGCQRGIVTDTDTTGFSVENFDILNSTSFGIEIGLGTGEYTPFRYAVGNIRNCFIAGSVGAAAISTSYVQSLGIENCRFGYEAIHDSQTETEQLQAVTADANSFNVKVKNCYVAGLASGVAFALAGASNSARGCSLESISGINTTSGSWLTDFTQTGAATALASNGTITTTALKVVRVTTSGAVAGAILQSGSQTPTGTPGVSQEVVVLNESANSITFAASGTSNVADGTADVIAANSAGRYLWDPNDTLWYRM